MHGNSKVVLISDLVELIHKVALQDTTVLLTGETGTGKTRLARLLHELSPRRAAPFRVINCGALAESPMESEMLGHVPGAFKRGHGGKLAAAGEGTLLLDEIDALSPAMQVELVRAMEERVFEPASTNKSVPILVRLIATSNRLLEQEVQEGRFRADLYYRLNITGLYLPPLRQRPEEISSLAAEFVAQFATQSGRPVRGLSLRAQRVLEAYSWPGNIRELRNVLERAIALCRGPLIQVDDLPKAVCSASQMVHGALAGGRPGWRRCRTAGCS